VNPIQKRKEGGKRIEKMNLHFVIIFKRLGKINMPEKL
tara:strand:+ start:229 stop:342 length:114 start_codon:yes stop_codon:yes gene_type:complete